MKYLITKAVFNEMPEGTKRAVDLNISTDNLEGIRRKIAERYRAEGVCLVYEEQ